MRFRSRGERETRWRLTFSRSPPRSIAKRKLRKAFLFAPPSKKRGAVGDVFRDFSKRRKNFHLINNRGYEYVHTENTFRRWTDDAQARFLVPESRPGNTAAPETKAIPTGERRAASYYMISGLTIWIISERRHRSRSFAKQICNYPAIASPRFISDLHRAELISFFSSYSSFLFRSFSFISEIPDTEQERPAIEF